MKKIMLMGFALLLSSWMQGQNKPVETSKSEKEVKNTAVGEQEKAKSDAKNDAKEVKKETVKTDKESGTYKGKKVYTDDKGKRYYLNSNNNKTYLDR